MKMILTPAETPAAEERLNWGHIVFFFNEPVLLIRADMATLELREGTPSLQATVAQLAVAAAALDRSASHPAQASAARRKSAA
jgi:hypothetical protein